MTPRRDGWRGCRVDPLTAVVAAVVVARVWALGHWGLVGWWRRAPIGETAPEGAAGLISPRQGRIWGQSSRRGLRIRATAARLCVGALNEKDSASTRREFGEDPVLGRGGAPRHGQHVLDGEHQAVGAARGPA